MSETVIETETDSRVPTAPPSEAVVEAVADAEGVSPLALEQPLYDVVDPDALDALFADGAGAVASVRFRYYGYTVEVTGDGQATLVHVD